MDNRQHEAFINEYKGNLFEFLVGKELALRRNLFPQFYAQLDQQYLERLQHYESELRCLAAELVEKLPLLARRSAQFLDQHYEVLERIELIGKDSSILHKAEGDLRLISAGKSHLLSLKLAKKDSQVNTKSGGIRSFITRYFADFSQAEQLQQKMNILIDQGFSTMMSKLYAQVGLEYQGKYDKQWVAAGMSELPGQLASELQDIIYAYYYLLAKQLAESLHQLFCSDEQKFQVAIMQLVGLSCSSVDQLLVFHHNHEFVELKFERAQQARVADQLKFSLDSLRKSYFGLEWGDKKIQIRLKPMNRFTQSSLKVNCTISS